MVRKSGIKVAQDDTTHREKLVSLLDGRWNKCLFKRRLHFHKDLPLGLQREKKEARAILREFSVNLRADGYVRRREFTIGIHGEIYPATSARRRARSGISAETQTRLVAILLDDVAVAMRTVTTRATPSARIFAGNAARRMLSVLSRMSRRNIGAILHKWKLFRNYGRNSRLRTVIVVGPFDRAISSILQGELPKIFQPV